MKQTDHLMPTYRRTALKFVRGDGAWLESDTGDKYLDFAAGIAVNVLGHNHPKLQTALQTQAQKFWHISNLYESAGQEALAEILCREAEFAERVFFCNSGAEAIEGTIKAARNYYASTGARERVEIITFAGAFHGRTLAALAAGKPEYGAGFGPLPQGFVQCPSFDIKEVEKCISDKTACILLEPIQGENGVRAAELEFLRALRTLADEHNILLAFDEVQTGLGRTGKLFAYQWAQIEPDLMALAKALGGGFPVGAICASQAVGDAMSAGKHGSTFGGNALAMAVGQAVMGEIVQPAFLENVCTLGSYFRQQLAQLVDAHDDVLSQVRGKGLMIGLQVKSDARAFVGELVQEKLLCVAASDNVVRFLPPLNITQEEIRQAIASIESVCKKRKTS